VGKVLVGSFNNTGVEGAVTVAAEASDPEPKPNLTFTVPLAQ
jgi:hypothetical protein